MPVGRGNRDFITGQPLKRPILPIPAIIRICPICKERIKNPIFWKNCGKEECRYEMKLRSNRRSKYKKVKKKLLIKHNLNKKNLSFEEWSKRYDIIKKWTI